jgi:hypothetical protein
MADNLDNLSNFSIQDTMEMGMGNQELLNDLFSPETASSNPEDVTAIITEKVTPDEVLTPARLLEITGLVEEHTTGEDSVTTSRRVVRWEYMDSQTFEVGEITSEGLVNAVKPKID